MLFAPATHPETYTLLLARSFNLYQHALKRTFILSLLFSAVIFTLRLLPTTHSAPLLSILDLPLSQFLVIYLGALWFFAAIYWRIHCVAINRHESFIEDFKTAAKKILYLLGAGIIIFVITYVLTWVIISCHALLIHYHVVEQKTFASEIIAFFALFIPTCFAFYVATLFIFYFPLIVIENDKIFLALKQSATLVLGNVWRTFSLQITPWIFFLIILMIAKTILFLVVSSSLPVIILQLIILAIFIPWSITTMIVQLQDLELRKKATNRK